ncbi:hypothetical protein JYU34_021674 [Plutella xylostella]|uniref:Uncharacterized protein n=1 Tax=Plutella xylostella TaxID=51655 RepID=A0ABQ7PRF9_PLUXY|nr:hypothetical protein JYU34_021674 [Plutella xylostella]
MKFVFALFVVVAILATSAVSGAWLPGVTSPNLAAAAAAAGVTPPSVGALGKVVTEGARAVDEWFPDDGFSTTPSDY